ncbi:hypothetical protein N7499_011320 [Penicillium canescens]|nr:hypothetical protein N7499_011320 [Penicillium canescens]KAJ6182514.1 hypothetical protein N7485_001156 [Penicillium canescens]
MEETISPYARAYSCREYRSWRFEQYVTDDLQLTQMMKVPNPTQSISGSRETVNQWKWWLRKMGIYKGLSKEEATYLKREVERISGQSDQAAETCNCFVIAGNELLLKNVDIDRSYARVKKPEHVKKEPTRRSLLVVQIPSKPNYLRQSDIFRLFQRLIFNTRVHFDSSFDAKLCAPDARGVHARSPELREELKTLSNMHNNFVEACKLFKSGNIHRGWTIVRSTFELNDRIVRIQHHRLFPDLLGILLLLQQNGCPEALDLVKILRKDLREWARSQLPGNDPRRQFFEFILLAPLESVHHLYLIFDSQCRQLWNSNVKDSDVGTYYSYNQASFPRADRGRFYSLFEGKTVFEICDILGSGDKRFGFYSTEAFCLWHTALQ